MAIYLGIDPGAKGCLCFLDLDRNKILFLDLNELSWTPKNCRETILAVHGKSPIKMAGIEDVHAIFGTSAGSNFAFGYSVGLLHGIVRTTDIGLDLVQPKTWQKAIGLMPSKPPRKPPELKKAVMAIALRLYPNAELLGPKGGILDGRADSLMIAHFLSLKYEGKLI